MTQKRALAVVPNEEAAPDPVVNPSPPSLPLVTPLGFEDGLARLMLIAVPDSAGTLRLAYKLWNTDPQQAMNLIADAVPLMRVAEQTYLAGIAAEQEPPPPAPPDDGASG